MLHRKLYYSSFPDGEFTLLTRNRSPQTRCAELAQQHAIEDLHNMTEHVADNENMPKSTKTKAVLH